MDLNSTLKQLKQASRSFVNVSDEEINQALLQLAERLEADCEEIVAENRKDLEKIADDDPIRDRVLLNEERIRAMAESLREIAGYQSPVGMVLEERVLDNGLELKKVSTPLGVVGAIFEARPNVVVDIFALCFKSKNACALKGGSQSEHSNEILVRIIKEAVGELGRMVELLPNDRELVAEFMRADQYVDLLVPRGSQNLIHFVRENALIPTIETGAGVVHTYVDESADLAKAKDIIFNAKVSRPSVCNALDTLIIHRERLDELIRMVIGMAEKEVGVFADEESYEALYSQYPANLLGKADEESFGREYLSLKMSIKTVSSLNEAIDHINEYGSGHSEAIVTENEGNAERFVNEVDAAAVYVNASTRFTDGAVFGLGAEVGISTQKLHARGPMGIKELTSYKWVLHGEGQIRI